MQSKDKNQTPYGWVITSSCFSIQAIGVGIFTSYGVFFTPLKDEFSWSRAAISGASSLAFLFMGVFGIIIGRLNDQYGPRILMSIAATFFGLGLCLMSQVNHLFQLYLVFGLIFGLGLSAVDVIALTTITRWFSHNRGKMTGLVKVGTGAGQFTFPILASFLIASFGWRNAFLILGIFGFIFLFAIAQLLRRNPVKNHHSFSHPTDDSQFSQDKGFSFSDAIKTQELWLISLIHLLAAFCLISIVIHIVPYLRDLGISSHKAAGVLSTIGAVSMLGRFVSGIAIDVVGSKKIMGICFGFLIVSLFYLPKVDTSWSVYLFACIYGIAHGGFFTTISPIVAEFFGIRTHGSLFGIVIFFGTVGGALGPLVTGYFFDINHNYLFAFRLILIVSCLAFLLLLILRTRQD